MWSLYSPLATGSQREENGKCQTQYDLLGKRGEYTVYCSPKPCLSVGELCDSTPGEIKSQGLTSVGVHSERGSEVQLSLLLWWSSLFQHTKVQHMYYYGLYPCSSAPSEHKQGLLHHSLLVPMGLCQCSQILLLLIFKFGPNPAFREHLNSQEIQWEFRVCKNYKPSCLKKRHHTKLIVTDRCTVADVYLCHFQFKSTTLMSQQNLGSWGKGLSYAE